MEAFSLLKYWRGSGAAAAHATSTPNANTIFSNVDEVLESDDEDNGDDGPFFDMEFTVDGNTSRFDDIDESDEESDECDCEDECEKDLIDPNISSSPSDDLFFKGRLVPLTEAEVDTDNDTHSNNNTNSKPVSKSTKLRVLMLKLKNSTKLSVLKADENMKYKDEKEDMKQQIKQSAKFFTVKLRIEEVPVLSMFTRDNSSKVAIAKQNKEITEKSVIEEEERVFSKDMVNKYLKKVKPLYVRVSKRYGEKLGFSGHLSQVKSQKQGISFPGKLRVVRKQLGKNKSASSTVTAAADSPPVVMTAKRRDDSLLQQQDGIQSAIMHCKRSFKASRDLEGKGKCEGNENASSTVDLSCSVDQEKGDMH